MRLLWELREYIPYMLEDEIIFIIFAESLPSAECVTRWAMERSRREGEIRARFRDAAARQREKIAKKSRAANRP